MLILLLRGEIIVSKTQTKEDESTVLERKLEYPKKYLVVFHNDDFTPTVFVVELLVRVFNKSKVEANEIMKSVHNRQKGIVGIYPKEIAETKVEQALDICTEHEHPLRITIEAEEGKT
jgi:ATP-dependent Clp protease adaptor protein ClpS